MNITRQIRAINKAAARMERIQREHEAIDDEIHAGAAWLLRQSIRDMRAAAYELNLARREPPCSNAPSASDDSATSSAASTKTKPATNGNA